MSKRIGLLGIPVDMGASVRGTLMGPAALRTAGLGTLLEEIGFEVTDYGDLLARDLDYVNNEAAPANTKHYREIQAWTRAIEVRAYEIARSGAVPIFLGGDHSLSMGSINGVARHWAEQGREISMLWFDAHADYNTPATTESMNLHGMSAAFLCGEAGLEGLLSSGRTPIDPGRLHMLGVRSIDREEREVLRRRRINVIDMRQIDRSGIGVLVQSVIDDVKNKGGMLHVSFDIDVLDPDAAPGVGTLVPGGITYREAHLVMEMLCDSKMVTSVDVVELNPFLDDRGRTARAAVELVGTLFGQQIFDRPTPSNAFVSAAE